MRKIEMKLDALYQPKIFLESSTEELLDCSVSDAQPWCNFIIFDLTYMPKGFDVIKRQLRKESNVNQSSFRYLLKNKDNQSISVKQFLYDWTPPAYDYPCLWLNTKKFSLNAFEAPKPVMIGERILWVGRNYRGESAATIDLERTRIEITYDKLNVDDEELVEIISGLKPCDEIYRQRILNTPFAQLSYYYRHKKNASDVPLSYWKHMRSASTLIKGVPINNEIDINWLPSHYKEILTRFDYYLNSIFEIATSKNDLVEKEFSFEHRNHPGIFIHLLVTPDQSIHPIQFPPRIGDQVCEHEILTIVDKEIYLAYSTQKYGNYEFVWKTESMTYLMIVRAAVWVSYEWVLSLVKMLIH